MLTDLLIDDAQLRMRLNSVICNAVNTALKPEKEDMDGVIPRKDQKTSESLWWSKYREAA
ncbi:hypothetical protein BRADI_4g27008v3 [Brachypodium distachyon]|uniref:Uncharacterized protein n=1 Tax=Brachypodium distachyon TaxID=15368 RepID=A0A0Q3HND4_BRADI|nr:hypothetical protein BRADI_4g27008v3 [Brachypodium distachyon]